MPLELRKGSDWWYGRYEINGKRHVVSLGIKVHGKPPPTLRKLGDPAFEKSRGLAQGKLDQYVADARGGKSSQTLIQSLHEMKYGSRIQSYPIDKLLDAWRALPKRRETLHPRYVIAVEATIKAFQTYLAANYPDIKEAAQVSRTVARQYLQTKDIDGLAAKSWNDVLKRLKAVFRFLQVEHGVLQNPFDGIQAREENQIHRKPFTEEEIARLLKAAEKDDFCRPLLVCGLSTAMRRGDCCLLKWADVTLDGPHPSITVKTGKTGETVTIPIYERLRAELDRMYPLTFGKCDYVWPAQAKMQLENQQGVSYRLREVFENAGFKEGDLRVKRKHGARAASVRDFHSLRTTWITEALTRGIPVETVKLISGHRTTEVVTEHYFRPDQAQVRATLEAAMPKILTGGKAKTRDEQMLEILDKTTAETWKADAAKLRALIAPAKAGVAPAVPALPVAPARPAPKLSA